MLDAFLTEMKFPFISKTVRDTLVGTDPVNIKRAGFSASADASCYCATQTDGRENWRFSCDFRRKSPFASETVRVRVGDGDG